MEGDWRRRRSWSTPYRGLIQYWCVVPRDVAILARSPRSRQGVDLVNRLSFNGRSVPRSVPSSRHKFIPNTSGLESRDLATHSVHPFRDAGFWGGSSQKPRHGASSASRCDAARIRPLSGDPGPCHLKAGEGRSIVPGVWEKLWTGQL